jgi:transposase
MGFSKPPPRSLRRPSGREFGGGRGDGGGRLARVAAPDEVIWHVPERCGGCGADLAGSPLVGDHARQVFDLPEIGLWALAHRAQQRRCGCAQLTTAAFPAGVAAAAQYGPRIRALGIYLILVARQHLPYQRAAEFCYDCFGVRISTATLVALIAQGAEDLHPCRNEVHRQICDSEVVHFDQTGARVQARTRWLDAASTQHATCFQIHDSRGVEGINRGGVLPHFTGIAVHDGYHCYRDYPTATHALGNAHHLRDLLGIIDQDEDHKQSWATPMDRLLRALKHDRRASNSRRPALTRPAPARLLPRRLPADHHPRSSPEPATRRPHQPTRADPKDPRRQPPAPPRPRPPPPPAMR